MKEYNYRVCKSSWGINITVSADCSLYNDTDKNALKISDELWLKKGEEPYFKNDRTNDIDFDYFVKGLSLAAESIAKKSKYEKTLITVYGVNFGFCDFQNEGLTAAIIEWAAEIFGFELPPIKVEFDKNKNRYIYDFSNFNRG